VTKPNLLVLAPLAGWADNPLSQDFTLHELWKAPDRAAWLAAHGPAIDAIATRGDLGANAALIAACPNARIISVFGVGFDAVDLSACRARGIRVTNTPDVLTTDVADLGVTMLLALSRNVVAADRYARSGDWISNGSFPLQRRISGQRAGILGLGRIGMAIATRLAAFDMDIAYSATAPKPGVTWEFIADPVALAARSDCLIVALAASAATRHIVSRDVIAALGPKGTVINISRAANIDEDALLDALEGGTLGGAALDVFEGEPALNPRFAALPNVLLQPHHGSATADTRSAMGNLMRDNLIAFFAGRDLPSPVL
jgi:lactate dehydrogenase-like 2-hydroxyacid dehydrogenase